MRSNKNNHTAILKHLRQDARKSFSTMSRESSIPVTTVFDNYQKLQSDGIIKKHASLLDFRKLGFFYRSFVFVKVKNQDEFLSFINTHQSVNSVFRIDVYDFLIDTVFPSIKEFYNFLDKVRDFDIEKLECHDVIEHIKKEEFLS
jgi:DNA-binding Lrp family transcriptional regulator